jgi:N-acetylmuramoyl-L-alanine amidase
MEGIYALVIGHSERDQGAVNPQNGMTEFKFNEKLAKHIYSKTNKNCAIVYRNSYYSLPNEINRLDPKIIISLHCNAFNTKATGTEALYYYKSRIGWGLATQFAIEISSNLGLVNRGAKPRRKSDRGGYLLYRTNAPCVIVEPFFIDNTNDYKLAQEKYNELVQAYVNVINDN